MCARRLQQKRSSVFSVQIRKKKLNKPAICCVWLKNEINGRAARVAINLKRIGALWKYIPNVRSNDVGNVITIFFFCQGDLSTKKKNNNCTSKEKLTAKVTGRRSEVHDIVSL